MRIIYIGSCVVLETLFSVFVFLDFLCVHLYLFCGECGLDIVVLNESM